MSANCYIPANPDISGIGVRISIYIQALLAFIPALVALSDGKIIPDELDVMHDLASTNLTVAFAILLSCFVQAWVNGLTSYHASIVLSMSWLNNSSAFIYLVLYIESSWDSISEARGPWHTRRVALAYLRRAYEPIKASESQKEFRLYLLAALHLTVTSALGLWLWQSPRTFGKLEDASICAVQFAEFSVLTFAVPFGSAGLRIVSLALYSLFAIFPYNVLVPALAFFAMYAYFTREANGNPVTKLKRAIPVCVGLGVLLCLDVILIADIELTLRRNWYLQVDRGEAEWGFGQILAMVLLLSPTLHCGKLAYKEIREKLRASPTSPSSPPRPTSTLNDKGTEGEDPYGNPARRLEAATLEKQEQRGRHVIDSGADFDKPFTDGETALHAACRSGELATVRDLLQPEEKPDLTLRDQSGKTPLQVAQEAQRNAAQVVQLLLEHGAVDVAEEV